MSVFTRCTNCGHVFEGPTWILGRTNLCGHCGQYFVARGVTGPEPEPAGKHCADEANKTALEPSEPSDPAATTDHASYAGEAYPLPPDEAAPPVPVAPPPSASSKGAGRCLGHIGRFELRVYLGHGSFGSVYQAYDPLLDRDVALKVPKFSGDQRLKVKRFLSEAKAAARLRHPNLVAVYESGQAGDNLYIASEFIAGMPLSARLAKEPPNFRQTAQWVRDLALALAYAHGEGIIHRDIKPDNIMIDHAQRPQLMDFGLAKRLSDGSAGAEGGGGAAADEDANRTVEGTVLGTPAYMAPEQARGDVQAVGPHSDQYSLGVVLYELLTRQRPFQGTPRQVLAQVIAAKPPRPRQLNRRVPKTLEAICLKAMAKDARERYPSVGDLAVDLQRWLKGESVQARPFTLLQRGWHWCWENPWAAATLAATAALLLTALAVSQLDSAAQLARLRRAHASMEAEYQQQLSSLRRQHEAETAQLQYDVWHESGLRYAAQGKPREAVVLLARAYKSAVKLRDRARWLTVADELLTASDHLPLLPELQRLPAPLRSRQAFRSGLHLPDCGSVVFAAIRPRPAPADGWAVLTSDGRSARLWDMATGKPCGPLIRYPDPVADSGFSGDGKIAVTRDTGGMKLTLRDAVTGESLGRTVEPELSKVASVYVGPAGGTVIVVGDKSGASQLEVWDTTPGRPPRLRARAEEEAERVAFSPDGASFLVWQNGRGEVELWDAVAASSTGRHSVGPGAPAGTVTDFQLHGRRLVACAGDDAREWDMTVLAPVGKRFPHPGLQSALYVPGERYLITYAASDARLWDLAASRELLSVQCADRLERAFVSTDGTSFFTIHPKGVSVWPLFFLSLFTGERPDDFVCWAEVVTGIEVAPDGSLQELDASVWQARRRHYEAVIAFAAPRAGEQSGHR